MHAIGRKLLPMPTVLAGCCVWAVVAGSWMASSARGAVALSSPPEAVADKILVVVDLNADGNLLLQNLAVAGYPTVEVLQGLPPRFNNYRLVTVNQVTPADKANLLAVPGVLAVRTIFQNWDTRGNLFPIIPNGQVVAKFNPGTPVSDVVAVAGAAHCTISREILGLPGTYVFDVDERQSDVYQAATQLRGLPGVRYAHASVFSRYDKHANDEAIEDPLFPVQWHLRNTGQLPGGVPGADVDAVAAWQITKGEGAIVAVIDDCLQRDHEDLKDNYLTGFDFVRQTGDPSPFFGPFTYFGDDARGDAHGTLVAGIIAARDNSIGVRGVAPRAQLIGCKINLNANQVLYQRLTLDQDIADAFLFAERNGAMAINNSWGQPGRAILPLVSNTDRIPENSVIKDAIDEVATNGRGGRGVLVLFSAGNDSILLSFGNQWAGLQHVMAVSATMRNDSMSCYSNFGSEASVSAPGGGLASPPGLVSTCFDSDIATTDVEGLLTGGTPYVYIDPNTGLPTGPVTTWPIRGLNEPMKFLDIDSPQFCPVPGDLNYYFNFGCRPLVTDTSVVDFPNTSYSHHMNGTSAACPNATGVAALVFSVNPSFTAVEVRNLLEHTADKVQDPSETFDAITGHNDHFGHGRVNAYRAVLAAQATQTWPSPVQEVQNVSSQALARISWVNPDWDGDGTTDGDVAGVLVARSEGVSLKWAPVDGVVYTVGQVVAPGVIIAANDYLTSLDQTGLAKDNFQYALFVRNAANFYSWGRLTSFNSDGAVVVPLASIQTSTPTGPAPLSVHLAGGGIDATGITSLTWNFGDGTTGVGPAVDHTYTSPGVYTAMLTVVNSKGQTANTTVRITVTSTGNALPIATASATPSTGTAPLVVLFQANATDSDGTIARYSWNFGDGSIATGRSVEHTYLDPGMYGVTLTATDNSGGQGMASVLITVNSTTTTAAEVVQDTTSSRSLSICGSGTASAVAMSVIGLCGLMVMRRKH